MSISFINNNFVFPFKVVAMVMVSILFIVVVSVSYHAYRTNVKWKKRRDEEINAEIVRNKRQSIQMQEGYKVVKVRYRYVSK